MNRRSFLKSLLTSVALTAITDIEIDKVISNFSHLSDDEFIKQDFVTYITVQMNLYVHNPRQCAYITNIVDDE